jgi:hypothetical protein
MYLAPTPTLSPNGPKWDSTWPTTPWSSIRCVQKDYHYLRMDWIKHPLEPRHLGVPSGASKTISEPTVCLAQTCKYLVPTPTLSPNGTKTRFHMAHVTFEFHRVRPPRSNIGCVQNDFWAYGMFSTNHAPVLNRHQHFSKLTKTWFHVTHVS